MLVLSGKCSVIVFLEFFFYSTFRVSWISGRGCFPLWVAFHVPDVWGSVRLGFDPPWVEVAFLLYFDGWSTSVVAWLWASFLRICEAFDNTSNSSGVYFVTLILHYPLLLVSGIVILPARVLVARHGESISLSDAWWSLLVFIAQKTQLSLFFVYRESLICGYI